MNWRKVINRFNCNILKIKTLNLLYKLLGNQDCSSTCML